MEVYIHYIKTLYWCLLPQLAMLYVIWASPASRTLIHASLPLAHCVSTRGPEGDHAELRPPSGSWTGSMPQIFTLAEVFW